MALISSFERVTHEKHTVHESVTCGYKSFTARNGIRYVQLDTYGSADRAMPGKVSQSIQLDRSAAQDLIQILQHAFPGLGNS